MATLAEIHKAYNYVLGRNADPSGINNYSPHSYDYIETYLKISDERKDKVAKFGNIYGEELERKLGRKQFKQTDAYKSLTPDEKALIDISYDTVEFGGEEEARRFANAIEQAKAVAEPYFKSQIELVRAEVIGKIFDVNRDYLGKQELIKRTRDELLQDVTRNKDFLTLEQQAEIAREARNYDEDLLVIADQAAEKGLTFATGTRSRQLVEQRRSEQFQDVVQSSRRKFNFQVKELELKAQRGDTAAQQQLTQLRETKQSDLQRIGRSAEEILGSGSNVPAIGGFTQVGGVPGRLEEEKRRAIMADIAGFYQLQKGVI